jgi:1,4-alpha-glucan branching enzyme
LFTAVGNPMLHQAQEFGGFRPRDLEIRPLQWELLDGDFGLFLKEHHAWLARTRLGSPALTGEELEILRADDGVLVYTRGYGQAEVVIAVNLRDQDRSFDVPLPAGNWHELRFETDLESMGNFNDSFPASDLKMFVRR